MNTEQTSKSIFTYNSKVIFKKVANRKEAKRHIKQSMFDGYGMRWLRYLFDSK